MNRKEMAQEFARQTIGQEEASKRAQENRETDPKEDVESLLKQMQEMQLNARRRYGEELTLHIRSLQEQLDKLERKAYEMEAHLRLATTHLELLKDQQKFGSRWLIRLYLIAILVGCCSALIAMIFLRWLKTSLMPHILKERKSKKG